MNYRDIAHLLFLKLCEFIFLSTLLKTWYPAADSHPHCLYLFYYCYLFCYLAIKLEKFTECPAGQIVKYKLNNKKKLLKTELK